MTTRTASYDSVTAARKGPGPLARAIQAVARFIGDVSRAAEMSTAYQQLANLSNEELARRGLKREDLPRHLFATYFADK